MSGIKGKCGGARPNSGGARPNTGGTRRGAGRPKNPENVGTEFLPGSLGETPLEVLSSIMRNPEVPLSLRLKAAKALLPYVHKRAIEVSKKEDAGQRASTASGGRFKPSAPPRLVVGNEKAPKTRKH